MPNAKFSDRDREEFTRNLKFYTDIELHGVYEKESAANRTAYARLAFDELEHRRLSQKTIPPI